MFSRKTLTAIAVSIGLLCATSPYANSTEPVPVVASFSILGDMVQRIGGAHVSVTTLVGPDGDTHVYQPTPADARAVSKAQLLFVNGLDFEGWIDRLVKASGFQGNRAVVTQGIKPIAYEDNHDEHHKDEVGKDEHGHKNEHADTDRHKGHTDDKHGGDHAGHDHGAFDPHAWQSLKNAVIYVDNITAALAKTIPTEWRTFYRNRAAYVAEIEALDSEIQKSVAELPIGHRTVVTSHDAFQYFARDYGLKFLAPQGFSTESEASAKDVATLIKQMREQTISAVFVENITDPRLIKQIADETGAAIGGTLYPGALSGPDGPAATYLDMMRHNATTLAKSLKP